MGTARRRACLPDRLLRAGNERHRGSVLVLASVITSPPRSARSWHHPDGVKE